MVSNDKIQEGKLREKANLPSGSFREEVKSQRERDK